MPTKILVVDDEPAMQQLIRMGFRKPIRKNEYEFFFALNGKEALEVLTATPEVGIILCDINMPVMNGLTFLSQLRESAELRKVIMVTAYGNMENIRAAMNGGAFDFVNKPIDFPDLQITLDKAIEALIQLQEAERTRSQLLSAEQELVLAEQKARQLRELDQVKSRFFTNISHEFRTPLTVIDGMADQLRDEPERWAISGGELIKRNSQRLLRLVGQILDLRKLETGSMTTQLIQANVRGYLKYIFISFQSLAESRGIRLQFEADEQEIWMDIDPDKLMSIASNLISNAIKYSEKGAEVRMKLSKEQEVLQIVVSDTGIGIQAEQLPHIFDRFYQADGSSTRFAEGTGVGLALTHELIRLFGGTIEVASEWGKGSQFTVHLPIRRQATVQDPLQAMSDIWVDKKEEGEEEVGVSVPEAEDHHLPSLLLVEDNPDIIQYLIACVGERYQIQIARDGQEGIDKALELIPDIIISDVMMPRKDGFELCESLKTNESTNHIPIILLTAKADIDAKLTGLGLGADAYLTKPFEKAELLIRLEKLVELRRKLQSRYQSLEAPNPSEHPIIQKQDAFIGAFKQIVENHLDDPMFKVPDLCKEIGMSRPSLHRKVKALTGMSTTHFVQEIRLQKAGILLQSTDYSISEIAYMTGFSTPAYFSKSYKSKYGESPSVKRKA